MEEMVPIVDRENNILKIVPRSEMRKNKLPHRASYIVLVNSEGKFYVQKRTMIKDYCPGMLDACTGGVRQAGEDDIVESGKRELLEEMGVKTELKYLGWYLIDHDNNEREDDFVYAGLFFGKYDGKIIMQESEVSDVYLMTYDEIIKRRQEFTPDSVVALIEVKRLMGLD